MSIDEKKAALTAAGYVVKYLKGGYYDWWIETPDEWTANEPSEEIAVDKAYAHWQREQELAALRAKVAYLNKLVELYEEHGSSGDAIQRVHSDDELERLLDVYYPLSIKPTATTLTHEDVSALRHNRLDSLYDDDDESSET